MQIGGRRFDHPLVLSPMVDVTDAAFRSIAKDWGADVTCSEMIAAVGLIHDNAAAWWHVQPWGNENPYGVQFMCGEPEEMKQAVTHLATRVVPDFVDVNLGCPAPNIMKVCAGGYLMRDPAKAGAVIRAARLAADEAGIKQVSAKMRLGPSESNKTYIEVAKLAEDAGADWVTLHARTISQGYTGVADWSAIGTLVGKVGIPVVGNGDLRDGRDVVRMRDETGCAGFFIARAAMIDPTIFHRMRMALDGKQPDANPGMPQRLETFLSYLDRAESIGLTRIGDLRRQATRFVAGAPGARKFRVIVHDAHNLTDLRETVAAELAALQASAVANGAA